MPVIAFDPTSTVAVQYGRLANETMSMLQDNAATDGSGRTRDPSSRPPLAVQPDHPANETTTPVPQSNATTDGTGELKPRLGTMKRVFEEARSRLSRQGGLQKVVLRFYGFTGRDVKLAGSFNDWRPDQGVVTRTANDIVEKIVLLMPGTYQYRLVVDGLWQEDPFQSRAGAELLGRLQLGPAGRGGARDGARLTPGGAAEILAPSSPGGQAKPWLFVRASQPLQWPALPDVPINHSPPIPAGSFRMTDLSAANARFGLSGRISFKEIPGGLVVMEVSNIHGNAAIALQGGHVMSWHPKSQAEPVVWLSRFAGLRPANPSAAGCRCAGRGSDRMRRVPGLPAHGFARTVPWEVTATRELDNGASEIALALVETGQTRAMWPHRAGVSLRVTVGATLEIALTTQNRDDHDLVIGEALHTYFQIGDIADIRIRGLEGCEYLDKAGGGSARRRQDGPVVFSAETDRIYLNTEAECVIEDTRLQRRIRVAKSGSRSTVVWNPWTAKADKMGDFGPDGWRRMVWRRERQRDGKCRDHRSGRRASSVGAIRR